MDIKIEGVEFPIEFIKNVRQEDNKVIISLWDDNEMSFNFKDQQASESEYNNIKRKLHNYKTKLLRH